MAGIGILGCGGACELVVVRLRLRWRLRRRGPIGEVRLVDVSN